MAGSVAATAVLVSQADRYAALGAEMYRQGRFVAACEALNVALTAYASLGDWTRAGACGRLIIMVRSKYCRIY